jgi:quinol monooxygenase YgiN
MIAKKGKEKELEEALSAMIPNVQNEEDTLQYSLHRSRNNPGKFFFYEKYKDQAAFDFHCSTSYFKELFSKTPGLLEG